MAAYNRERYDRPAQERRALAWKSTLPCVDCSVDVPQSRQGRAKLRCDPCRKTHNRQTSRYRQASWVRDHPDEARERWRKGYRRNAERIRREKLAQHYRRKYGLTIEQRDQMLERQGGLCAICRRKPVGGGVLHVDHCHATGVVRALLCTKCNTLIGLADENPDTLRAAIDYLSAPRSGEGGT